MYKSARKLKISNYLERQIRAPDEGTEPGQGAVHESEQSEERNEVDGDVRDQFDRGRRAHRGRFDDVSLGPSNKSARCKPIAIKKRRRRR